jgi:hypothetical protein
MTSPIKQLKELHEKATPDWKFHIGFDRCSSNPGCYGGYLELGHKSFLMSALTGVEKDCVLLRNSLPQIIEQMEDHMSMTAKVREYFTAIEEGEYPKSRPALRAYEKIILDRSRELEEKWGEK